MSEEMAPSWRSLASAASRSIRGYITQQRELKQAYPAARGQQQTVGVDSSGKQSWSQWAGQKWRRGSQGEYDTRGDRLALFPGWAARRYREPLKGNDNGAYDLYFPFGLPSEQRERLRNALRCRCICLWVRIQAQWRWLQHTRRSHVFASCEKYVVAELLVLLIITVRTSVAGFAALPKLPTATGLSRSTEDLLVGTHLPPLPDEITDESELQALDDRLRRLEFDAQSDDGSSRLSDPYPMKSTDSPGSRTPSTASAPPTVPGGNDQYAYTSGSDRTSPLPIAPYASSDLHRWHANLEARLHPFWSSVLSNRVVRVSLYAVDSTLYDSEGQQSNESVSSEGSVSPEKQPIVTREVTTAVDGSFQLKFSVPWERMCVHPGALQIAFGGSDLEHELFVAAELLAPPSPDLAPPPGQYAAYPNANHPTRQSRPLSVTTTASIPIPLSHSSIRVISDIDDTVKLSGILNGARAVFHNVFVKDLRDSVIRGMGDWYTNMWKRGVRFHYVVSYLSASSHSTRYSLTRLLCSLTARSSSSRS